MKITVEGKTFDVNPDKAIKHEHPELPDFLKNAIGKEIEFKIEHEGETFIVSSVVSRVRRGRT